MMHWFRPHLGHRPRSLLPCVPQALLGGGAHGDLGKANITTGRVQKTEDRRGPGKGSQTKDGLCSVPGSSFSMSPCRGGWNSLWMCQRSCVKTESGIVDSRTSKIPWMTPFHKLWRKVSRLSKLFRHFPRQSAPGSMDNAIHDLFHKARLNARLYHG